ncbi:hypothetical protein [Clostridium aceticum]|nr:hypothetical protein [Clostridium aceticum]
MKVKITKIRDDVEKNSFYCPECGCEYIAFYTNQIARELQKEVNETIEKFKKQKNLPKKKTVRKIEKTKKKIRSEMQKLKDEIERDEEHVKSQMSSL